MSTMENTLPKTHDVCLGLGSNLGDRLKALRAARDALAPYVQVRDCSHVYEAVSVYSSDQPRFLNAVVRGTTTLDPMGLLYTIKDIELIIGRRPTFHFGPRIIDIDILYMDDLVVRSPDLSIPHVGMHQRLFVLAPLVEIAPQWVHPILKKTVLHLLEELPKGEDRCIVDVL